MEAEGGSCAFRRLFWKLKKVPRKLGPVYENGQAIRALLRYATCLLYRSLHIPELLLFSVTMPFSLRHMLSCHS